MGKCGNTTVLVDEVDDVVVLNLVVAHRFLVLQFVVVEDQAQLVGRLFVDLGNLAFQITDLLVGVGIQEDGLILPFHANVLRLRSFASGLEASMPHASHCTIWGGACANNDRKDGCQQCGNRKNMQRLAADGGAFET